MPGTKSLCLSSLAFVASCTIRTMPVAGPAPASPPPAQVVYGAPPAAPPPAAPVAMEDQHWLLADDVFVSERPMAGGDLGVTLAKMTQPATPERHNEAAFLQVRSGKEMWTEHYWVSRVAHPSEIGIGTLVIYFNSNPYGGMRAAPRDKNNARNGSWVMARVVDLSDLNRGQIRVAGQGQPVALNNLRLVASGEARMVTVAPPAGSAAAPVATVTVAPPVAPPAPAASPVPVAVVPGEDGHWIAADDFFISDRPFVRDIGLQLAKMLQPPTEQTHAEGHFLITRSGKEMWTGNFWRTRMAQPSELAVGTVVVYFNSNPGDGARQAPRDKNNARSGSWVMSRITSLEDMYKNQVRVAGQGSPVAVANMRLLVQ